MANEDDLELNPDEDGAATGGKGKLLIIIGAVLLLAGGGAAFFLLGDDVEDGDATEEVATESEEVVTEGKGEAIYIAVPNGIVAQLPSGKRMTTLQVQLDMRVRSPEAADMVTKHMPLIENDLLMFFSSADAEEIKTVAGKNKLREGALKTIQDIMTKETGKPMVEIVLFSGFVMQR